MKKKILIVESEKAILHSFRSIFPSSEFVILPAVSGSRKAIETVKRKKPDIVIIRPVVNGALSGRAAAERIIKDFDVPVIFLIDKADKKTMRGSKVNPVSGFIVMPVDKGAARAAVDIALVKHHFEQELRVQRHRLSAIMKSVGDAVIAADRKGRIQFMNSAAEKLTGWSEGKAVGKLLPAVFVVVNESTGRKFPNPAAKIIKAHETVPLYSDAIVLSKDGSRYVIEGSGTPIANESGGISGVIVSFQDVTERRRIESENKKNEQRFRALVEKSSEAVSILDIDGTIRFTATATTTMLGYTQQEFIGRNAFDFAHPDELEKNTELFSRIIKSRGKGIRAELRFRHKNNSWRWLETISTNFVDDPAIDGIVVNFRDITARKEFEERLNYTNKRLGLISRVTSEVIGSQPISRQIFSMIQQVRSAFNVDTVIVRRLEGEELFLLASTGVNEENIVDTISSRKGIAHHIFTDKSAVAYANVRESFPEYFNGESGGTMEHSFDFVSYAGAPLLIGHTIIGMIGLFTVAKQRMFSSTDLEHLQIVANHIAVAIANNRLFREIRDQNIEMVKHIDEQNKVESLLRESEERYRALVEFSPTAIVVHVNGVLRFANQAALSLVGASTPDELIGTSVMKYVHPSYRALAKKRITQVYANQPVSTVEQKWIRLNGSTVDVETISIPFVYEGENAAQVIARDITERKKAEEALQESELRFRSLFENAKDAVFIADTKTGVIVDANAEAEKLLKRPRAEIIGMHQSQLHPLEKVDTALSVFREQMLMMGEHAVEFEVIDAAGHIIPVEIKSSVIRLDDDRVVLQGIFRDITERKLAEKELREKEERYRAFVEQSSEGIYRTAFDEPISIHLPVDEQIRLMYERSYIVECNAVLAKMYGFVSIEKTIGTRISSLLIPTDPFNIVYMREFVNRGYRFFDQESHEADINSNPKYFLNNAIGILDGDLWVGVWGTQRDITDRKLAEEALRQSEEKYRTLFEGSKDGIYISTEDGRFVDANPALVEILGYSSKEELFKLNIQNEVYWSPVDREKFKKAIESKSFVKDIEVSLKRKDGTEVNGIITATAERTADSGVILYRGTIRDITDKKRLEQQLIQAQKMESIGTLAGGIAHDFNNLLAMILGMAELVKHKTADNPKIVSYVDKIIDASERGASISKQLLLFSRPEQAELKPVIVRTVVEEVRDFLIHFLPKNITVESQLPKIPAIVLGDVGHLHQAFVNLALNAKDAMPEGGTITISIEQRDGESVKNRFHDADSHSYVAVSVTDTGTGMTEEVRRRIFEPFYSTKARGKGTGLGLAIVHGIAALHNALMDVQSELGKGTTFTMLIPAITASITDTQTTKEEMTENNHETILIVDDEEMLREILVESLEEEGYRVLAAVDGYDAITIYTEHQQSIKLVITDLGMPNMGGEELFERLKKINPGVRVIVSSGFLDSSTKSGLLRKGIRDVLTKPYKFDSIFTTIRKAIDSD